MPTAAVLTISDRRSAGDAPDASGPEAAKVLNSWKITVAQTHVLADDADAIRERVKSLANSVNLIVTTGGSGVGPRDVTPEAVEPLFDRRLPGFGEIMRTATFDRTPLSIISRGGAGLIGRSLVVMLPGSPKAVKECLDVLGPAIRHVLAVLEGAALDCAQEATR